MREQTRGGASERRVEAETGRISIAKSLGQVTLIAILLGAGLPLVFAIGIRLWSLETAVVVAVVLGIVYIAEDFISHTFDIQLFGAEPPKK
ncbi:hypothetical protein BJY24_006321 [Nocardia transvalensis]|uniref:Uncharacterized protein n=1 Tax=Nocardia transvalensis TaxID=37333 RepID=A0A7W9PJP5_9NOCA|nr:hypothetical protein [Nocardia transvalensis]MBB5917409.1 hypothetical protein [Nocardia transvalensis]